MKVTLYKNCALNDSYIDVFDMVKQVNNKTLIENYLTTLESNEYNIDGIYLPASGTLSLNITALEIISFNYMKLYDEQSNFTRYCFVTSCNYINACLVITYSEDVWHTWSAKLKGRSGLLTTSRSGIIGENSTGVENAYALSLPQQPYTADDEVIVSLADEEHRYCSIIATVQFYTTREEGQRTNRFSKTVLVTWAPSQGGGVRYTKFRNNLDYKTNEEPESALDILTAVYGVKYATQDQIARGPKLPSTADYFEITNLYIVPNTFVAPLDNYSRNDFLCSLINSATAIGGNILTFYDYFDVCQKYFETNLTVDHGGLYPARTYYVFPVYQKETLEIGFFTYRLPYQATGKNVNIDVLTYVDDYNFRIYLEAYGGTEDITIHFQYNLPIDFENYQSQQMHIFNRKIEWLGALHNIMRGVLNIGQSGEKFASAAFSDDMLTKVAGGISGAKYLEEGITDIASGSLLIDQKLRKQLFQTASNNFADATMLINCYLEACRFVINQDTGATNNIKEIEKSIDTKGYDTNCIINIDNYFTALRNHITDYDCVTIPWCNIWGDFSNDVRKKISSILASGVRIWYTPQGF